MLVGDLLISRIGSGWWQITLVVILAVAVAVFADGGSLLVNQAAASAVLVATLLPPGQAGGLDRCVDALIGGLVGVLVVAVLPSDPVAPVRRDLPDAARRAGRGARGVADALRDRDADAALRGAAAGPPHPAVRSTPCAAALRGGREVTAVSPMHRRRRRVLAAVRASWPNAPTTPCATPASSPAAPTPPCSTASPPSRTCRTSSPSWPAPFGRLTAELTREGDLGPGAGSRCWTSCGTRRSCRTRPRRCWAVRAGARGAGPLDRAGPAAGHGDGARRGAGGDADVSGLSGSRRDCSKVPCATDWCRATLLQRRGTSRVAPSPPALRSAVRQNAGMSVTVVVGNPKPASRALDAATLVATALAGRAPDDVIDVVDLGAGLLGWGDPAVARAVQVAAASDQIWRLARDADRAPGSGASGIRAGPAGPCRVETSDTAVRVVRAARQGACFTPPPRSGGSPWPRPPHHHKTPRPRSRTEETRLHPALVLGAHRHRRGHRGRPGRPGFAKQLKILADLFIQLIKVVIGPVIFCTVIVGIASLGNLARAGGLALRALGYFLVATVDRAVHRPARGQPRAARSRASRGSPRQAAIDAGEQVGGDR